MGVLFKKYKRVFLFALQPIFAMLASKYEELSPDEWSVYLRKTVQNVMHNPQEYLGKDLPTPLLMRDVMDEIVKEFVVDVMKKKKGRRRD